jgi:hypothetical protein
LEVTYQQHSDQRRPDLNVDGILAGANEGLDAQRLLDRLEEQLSGEGLARY